jgi:hypothetical protein
VTTGIASDGFGTDEGSGTNGGGGHQTSTVEVAVTASSPVRVRLVAITGAIAVLAAAGGFLVGRASAPDGGPRIASAPSATSPAASSASSPGETDEAPTATEAPASAAGGSDDESTAATVAAADGMGGGGGMGSWSPNAYAEPAQTLVFERTLDDGTVIRVHGQWFDGDMYGGWPGFEDWEPAPWCQPTGNLRVAIAAPDSINVSWAPWYREAKDGLAVSTFATGYVESAPRFGVVAQVGADVTSVTLTTPTGTDTAVPVSSEAGPVVVLLVPGPITDDLQLELERSSGTQTATPSDLMESWNSPEFRDACQPPPPALPEPGEQPADAAAAEAAVRDSFDTIRAEDIAERLEVIDDVTGIEAAWAAIAAGQYADAAAGATFTIRDFVFSSPTEAWFRYDIESSAGTFTDRYGRAVLGGDGTWLVTRDTVCQDLALAMAPCDPQGSAVLPPSAANDPRYGPAPFEGEGSVVTTIDDGIEFSL